MYAVACTMTKQHIGLFILFIKNLPVSVCTQTKIFNVFVIYYYILQYLYHKLFLSCNTNNHEHEVMFGIILQMNKTKLMCAHIYRLN